MLQYMFRCFLFAVLGLLALAIQLVHAQDQSGFISLDCGSPRDSNYTETTTGIDYISDAAFIDNGIGKRILPEFQVNKQQQIWYVRSFPDGIRNCYKFNLTKGSNYLILATFLYGNYDELDSLPEFDLHIGPNKWTTIKLQTASFDVVKEIIHVLPSSYLSVCLVNTGSGTPFISALELRPLKSSIYKTQAGSLEGFARLDVGSTTNQTVRYGADIYDRIWWPFYFDNTTQLSTSLTVGASNNDYQPPSVVMRSAGTPSNASAPFEFYLDTNNDTTMQFYIYFHFAEIQKLQANESRQLNISFRGKHWYGPFSPAYLSTTTVYNQAALSGGNYTFSIYKTEDSIHPPILNALEVFSVKEFLQSQTDQTEVDAVTKIKLFYGLKRNWQGDPCAPQAYLWNGLNCSYNNDESIPPRIISLNLSSCGLTGEIAPSLINLTLLDSLDLSNNNLTGPVPDFLSQIPLRVLNLGRNKLTGSVPVGLIERSKNGHLLMNVAGNPGLTCPSGSCEEKKKKSLLVPVVAAVAGSAFLIGAALAIFFILKRRPQVGKVKTESDNRIESFETKKREFLYSEVQKITKNFKTILGKGGFGTVYHGCIDGTDVAVKTLSASSVQGFRQFQAEVELLMRVHHRNLTSLVGFCNEGTQKALIYEYMANGNLQEHLSGRSTNVLTWEDRLRIAVEAAQGLEYLHHGCKPPIVHRDVKSTNILLNEKFQAKLADFGLSKSFPTEGSTHVSTVVAGTPGYLDPEYYISNRLTEKSDVHSFGVVLLEIITCRPVIAKISAHEKIHISQWVSFLLAKGDIKSIVDPGLQGDFAINSVWKAVEVAMACVGPTANKRPTMNQVVMELNQCLAAEMARTNSGYGLDSKDSVDHKITMNFGTQLNPPPRAR